MNKYLTLKSIEIDVLFLIKLQICREKINSYVYLTLKTGEVMIKNYTILAFTLFIFTFSFNALGMQWFPAYERYTKSTRPNEKKMNKALAFNTVAEGYSKDQIIKYLIDVDDALIKILTNPELKELYSENIAPLLEKHKELWPQYKIERKKEKKKYYKRSWNIKG